MLLTANWTGILEIIFQVMTFWTNIHATAICDAILHSSYTVSSKLEEIEKYVVLYREVVELNEFLWLLVMPRYVHVLNFNQNYLWCGTDTFKTEAACEVQTDRD